MRKIKNVFTLLMSVVLMVLNSGNACFASSSDNHYEACSTVTPHTTYGTAIKCDYDLPLNTDSSTQYFLFTPNEQRMNPDGSFIFSYSWAMPGDQFKPANSTIRVYVNATSSNSHQNFYIHLHNYDDSCVTYVSFTADGNTYYYDFTGLDVTKYYHLYFTKGALTGTITGSGQINYIQ